MRAEGPERPSPEPWPEREELLRALLLAALLIVLGYVLLLAVCALASVAG